MNLCELFPVRKPVIGMVHLLPLPGSPHWGGKMDVVLGRAWDDACTWAAGGADGLLVENYGDHPFSPDAVEPHTVAAMALAAQVVQEAASLPFGINVLRNDARSALGIAAALGAQFIRVNVHTGAMLTDQGILQGSAYHTLRLRQALGVSVALFADVMVKHAAPVAPIPLERIAVDTFTRGHADALIVSGAATGQPTAPEEVRRVKEAVPAAPVLVGSGVDAQNVRALLEVADAVIVGTSVKADGVAENAVSPLRVAQLMRAVEAARAAATGS